MPDDLSFPPSKKRFPVSGCLLIVIGPPLLLVLFLGIAYWWWSARSASLVQAEFDALGAAGEPVSAEDLRDFYPVPPGEADCTHLWLRATRVLAEPDYTADCGELPVVGTGEGEIPPPGEPWPEADAAEALLERYADSMKLMHKAARRGGAARYPVDFEAGLLADLGHAINLRPGAEMLVLEAHLRARQDDPQGVMESMRAIVRLAESLEKEPLLVSQLVRMTCTGIALELLGELLPHVDFSDDDLARLQAELEAVSYKEGMQRAMIGERVIGIEVFQNPAQFAEEVETSAKLPIGSRNDDLLKYLEFMNGIVAATRLDGPGQLEAAEDWDDELSAFFDNAGLLTKVRYVFTSLMIPAVGAAVQAEHRSEALRRAAVARIAVERYRLKHGKLPDALEQLVPEFLDRLPSDPFDDKPLRYVIRDGKPVIYSIGRDRTDDGGRGDDRFEPDVLFPIPAEEEEGF